MASSVSWSKSCTTPDSADDKTLVSIISGFLCRDDDEPSSDSSSALLPVNGTTFKTSQDYKDSTEEWTQNFPPTFAAT